MVVAGGAVDGNTEVGCGVVGGNGVVGWGLAELEGCAVEEMAGSLVVAAPGVGVEGRLGAIVDGRAVVKGAAVEEEDVGTAVVGGAVPFTQR